ncbi:MAG: hypothetical protein KDD82_11000, partial [Planctomycetes bacterium]|nr:hypothetical protein [Planctomycetota bacterium]
ALADFERHARAAREAGLPPPLARRLDAWRQILARDLTGALNTLDAAPPLGGAWAQLARGWAYYYRSELPQAQRAGEAALAADPELYEAHDFMSMIHSRFGRGADALAHLDRMLQLRGTNTRLLINRAAIRASTGDLAGCVADCNELLRLEPRNAVARLNLGKAYVDLGQAQAALGHLDFLVDLLGAQEGQLAARARGERARARLALGDGPGALEDLREQLRLDPYDPLAESTKAAIKELEEKLGGGTPSPDPPR